jgi:hypothetical protein
LKKKIKIGASLKVSPGERKFHPPTSVRNGPTFGKRHHNNETLMKTAINVEILETGFVTLPHNLLR